MAKSTYWPGKNLKRRGLDQLDDEVAQVVRDAVLRHDLDDAS